MTTGEAPEPPKLRACARACCLPTVATLKSENRRKFAVKCRRENYQLLASLQYFSSLSEIKPLLCFTVDASISVMATLVHRSTRPVKVTYLKQISLFRRPTIRHEAEGYSRWSKNRVWKQKDDLLVTAIVWRLDSTDMAHPWRRSACKPLGRTRLHPQTITCMNNRCTASRDVTKGGQKKVIYEGDERRSVRFDKLCTLEWAELYAETTDFNRSAAGLCHHLTFIHLTLPTSPSE